VDFVLFDGYLGLVLFIPFDMMFSNVFMFLLDL
jgi:hypothetical protein